MKRHRFLICLFILFGLLGAVTAGFFWGRLTDAPSLSISSSSSAASVVDSPSIWTCSMHPQIRLPNPGMCPICEMPLTPAGFSGGGNDDGPPSLQLSNHALAMARIATSPVQRRPLTRELRTVGKIQYNESSLATITARVKGYAERLFVDFTGIDIRKGDHLVEIYSPQLIAAQQELLIALQGESSGLSPALAESARLRLRRWGMTTQQIEELATEKAIAERVTLYSPISGTVLEKTIVQNSSFQEGDVLYRVANLDVVWAYVDIYEYDLPWVRYGQQVKLVAEALPGQVFSGRVTFVQPIVNELTRTIRIPVHIDNPKHALKPGMFVSAAIQSTLAADGQAAPTGVEGMFSCPMHPQVLQAETGLCPHCEMALAQIPGQKDSVDKTSVNTSYFCPMHCEGKKTYQTPGNCPVCNMKLKQRPEPQAAPAIQAEYYCPMHCEGEKTYQTPGNCPVCNMKLTQQTEARRAEVAYPLTIPVSAVLDSGRRQLAYVEREHGLFEPRELTLGPRADDFYPVLHGLREGERVVTRGGFLLDSQFQITGQPSLLYPGGLLGEETPETTTEKTTNDECCH